MTNLPLAGRNAVVTGAASGIGAAIAEQLAADGATVALVARRTDRLDDLAGKLGAGAFGVGMDVTSQDSVDHGVGVIGDRLGRVDLLVNAAGVMLAAPVEQVRLNDWTRMIDTNLTGVLRLIGAFTPDLIAAGSEGKTADLVNISSIGAHLTFPGYGVYSATKAALTHLSASLRADLSPYDVRVTNIEPGLTATELGDQLDGAGQELLATMNEQIGPLEARDIADVVAFAVSRRREVNLRQIIALPTRQA
ncbi:NADP-dependent 3-hydroxy acid dehydrogenase YdfG [Kribbella antiqua]|uniref:NADP-dependent 3-hydroxy acid dehydrogenase YdfG n=1 Tax=Kribbella antiqua TaxID=2512217 RepID=A0A4V2S3E8_9ACTN|nr:SDR family oxidoreductase [Kribbella antiqua]TCO44160.1 NADP-dependent 3-hydroxy acid dehydrogenase YdfG [Kribbella antiqua]